MALPVSSFLSRSEASSDATSAQRSTLVTAWHRYWKKSVSRPRHAPSTATLPRANISTSSISTNVREPLGRRARQQVDQQRLGRRRLALLVPAPGVQRAEARRARDLEGEHAPGVLQPA